MNQTLDIQDFSIVLAARNHNPTLVTPDFLRGSGVVPGDWELARPPALSPQATQIIFKNGIKIEAQVGTISFSQGINTPNFEDLELPGMARRYATTLPNLEYRGVGINPRRFVAFGDGSDQAHKYITETILSHGSWQEFGTASIQATINLIYTLEHCQLRLGINEARLQSPDRDAIPAVVFTGNFHYDVAGESAEERLKLLHQILDNSQKDFLTYRELIDSKFLAGSRDDIVSVLPAVAIS
ncbi:MAG TPA: hypothetical protein DCL61_05620 [Cyanobacteria bacterium UBA12227]|nr:hypothetical protein [Cyanobacteria bacterium UBA12227]